MALIENSIGELPYKLLDSRPALVESCGRLLHQVHAPRDRLDTAVRPIMAADGKRKILLANDRIVTALENDLDQAYVPGSLVETPRARASGERPRAVL
ncbi:hypothetical protein [Streptomyces sp. KL116D]|uniref:hypothetical protein n=1 Tax=Streptomyces sp. KL116D TaxID=3045152 RepID=UPI0035580F34